MDAEVSLVLISSYLTEAEISAATGLKATSVSINKEKQRVWSKDSGDISIDEVEATITNNLAEIKSEFENIEIRQIWIRIHSTSDFAGFTLTSHGVQYLAKACVDLIVSTYAEGKDWGKALE